MRLVIDGQRLTAGRTGVGRCLESLLADWADRVRAELGIADAPLDIEQVLGVAGVAAHAVMRPAAPGMSSRSALASLSSRTSV